MSQNLPFFNSIKLGFRKKEEAFAGSTACVTADLQLYELHCNAHSTSATDTKQITRQGTDLNICECEIDQIIRLDCAVFYVPANTV